LQAARTNFERNGKPVEEIIVFLIFTRQMDEYLYGRIKFESEVNRNYVTQVITETTVKKSLSQMTSETPTDNKSIFYGIFLKLNAKLGGVNQITEIENAEESSLRGIPSHEETMFIGIDVIHPSPNGALRDCSIAAITVSMDEHATKYCSKIVVNPRCNETVQLFSEKFAKLLAAYHGNRGMFPRRIVILRDGVSDSEMIKAASKEMDSIRGAWTIAVPPGTERPLFTYIVVQKRHKTRFFKGE
ncbi:hypothetical protein PFISCL1PPCAC_26351, partial [Pristionchus fissidentatus]